MNSGDSCLFIKVFGNFLGEFQPEHPKTVRNVNEHISDTHSISFYQLEPYLRWNARLVLLGGLGVFVGSE